VSDVVAVAAITGAFSLGTAGVTGFVTYKITHRNAEATKEAAERSAEVEMARLREEAKRPIGEAAEHERKLRSETYRSVLASHTRIHALGTTRGSSMEAVDAATASVQEAWAAVMLIDAPEVRARMRAYGEALASVTAEANRDRAKDFSISYRPRMWDMVALVRDLADAMRVDIAIRDPSEV
jgi:hypothetical protein